MAEIKVRGLESDVVERLTQLAKAKGYPTREPFLRDVLIQLSLDELQLDTDKKYQELMERLLNQIETNHRVIDKNNQILEQYYAREDFS